MAALVWPRPDAPRVLFAHANGFNAGTYRRALAPLSDRFEVVAVDLRGHGRSTLPVEPRGHRDWSVHARDLAEVAAQLADRPLAFSGHSLGGTSLLLAAARMKCKPATLALVEPVAVMPPVMRLLAHTPVWPLIADRMGLVRGARTRTDGWADRNAVLARYRDKALFAAWAPGVLEDYLADGLVDTEDGGVRLACAPRWEAANFAAQGHDPIAAARRAGAPVRILKAERGSTVRRAAALARAGAIIDVAPGAGHLMPMERPAETAAWLGDTLAAAVCAT